MGCSSSNSSGATAATWRCQFCGASFASYTMADQHEKFQCPARQGGGAQWNPAVQQQGFAQNAYGGFAQQPGFGQQPGRPPQIAGPPAGQPQCMRCGQCGQVFGIPPGCAQVRCPKCNTVNALPNPQPQQATIPTQVYNQQMGMQQAMVCGQPGPQPSGRKKALLVGINYPRTQAELRGCINDVHRMRDLLVQMYGFPQSADSMLVLTDDQTNPNFQPTRANILRAMQWLSQGAQPGDVLFFHYSGHGAQQEDPSYAEEDGYDETICPGDFQRAGMIVDDEIFDSIVAPLPAGVKLTAVMDCCHSGTGLDLPFELKSGQWVEDDNPCHSQGDVILISGCQDDQCSSDGGGGYGRPMGAMTTALCNTLERQPMLTISQLLGELRGELRRGGFEQIPSITSSQRFDPQRKPFNPCDYIDGNTNPMLGRQLRKKKHPKRANLIHGGLGQMLMAGAAGFLVADMMMGGDVMSGLAIGGMDMAMGGAGMMAGGMEQAAAGGGGFLGEVFGGGGDLFGGGGGDFFD